MATITGAFKNNSKNVQPWIEYNYSQNINNNTTTITAKLYVKRLTSYGESYSSNSKFSITIGGTTVLNKTGQSIDVRKLSVGASKLLGEASRTITHSADGKLTTTVAGMVEITGSSLGVGNVSQSITFPTIARATTPSISGSGKFGNAITINHSGASSSFTHTLKYTIGSATGTIVDKKSGSSTSWTIPKSLQSQIPNSTTGNITITCITYNGSTEIGNKIVSFNATIADDCVPLISSASFADAMSKPSTVSGYYQNFSKVKATIAADGIYGSKILTYKLKVGSMPEVASSSNIVTSGTLPNAGAYNITVVAVDSRGKTATKTYSNGITATAYNPPVISSFSYQRTILSDGIESPSNMGTIGYITHSGTIQSNMPTAARQLQYKPTTTSSWTTISLPNSNQTKYKFASNLNGSTAYNLKLIYKDDLTTVEKDLIMTNVFPLISLNAKGNGLAFGKDSTAENLIDIDMNVKIKGGVPYTTSNKPSVSELGALPLSGGYMQGQLYGWTPNRTNGAGFTALTTDDGNGKGDGNSHIGYKDGNGYYHHYFRGKGIVNVNTHGGLAVNYLIKGYSDMDLYGQLYMGDYEDKWKAVSFKRRSNGRDYNAKFGISYNNEKLSSSSSQEMMYGGVIEAHDTVNPQARYMFTNKCFFPDTDNNKYLGCSTKRWQAAYCTEGKFYTSTKSYKTNINYIDDNKANMFSSEQPKSIKDYIVEAIKDTPLAVYNYKTRMMNNPESEDVTENPMFVGFIADDLAVKHPEFFDLIGEKGEHERPILNEKGEKTDKTVKETQYDISDISMLGVLWAGLQEALKENDKLKQEIELIKEKLN